MELGGPANRAAGGGPGLETARLSPPGIHRNSMSPQLWCRAAAHAIALFVAAATATSVGTTRSDGSCRSDPTGSSNRARCDDYELSTCGQASSAPLQRSRRAGAGGREVSLPVWAPVRWKPGTFKLSPRRPAVMSASGALVELESTCLADGIAGAAVLRNCGRIFRVFVGHPP